MKKIYFYLFVFLPVISFSQITITQGDLPSIGWGYINAVDSNYSAAIPPGGAGQSWNYASLQNNYQDSLLFLTSVGTPFASMFPNANLATYNPNDTSYGYFISNSSGFYLNGGSLAQFNNFVAVYNPPQMLIPVPFTYNSTHASYYRLNIDTVLNGDSARIILNTQINLLGDGYGALTLPNLSEPNTLRIKKTSLQTDSIWVKLPIIGWFLSPPSQRQTTEFVWVRNGGGTLLLDINADSLGVTGNQSSYLLNFGILGIDEFSNTVATKAYPNPAPESVTFSFKSRLNDESELIITNQFGQVAESFSVSHLNDFTMTTGHLSSGLYSYIVRSKNGINSKGKFIVVH